MTRSPRWSAPDEVYAAGCHLRLPPTSHPFWQLAAPYTPPANQQGRN